MQQRIVSAPKTTDFKWRDTHIDKDPLGYLWLKGFNDFAEYHCICLHLHRLVREVCAQV